LTSVTLAAADPGNPRIDVIGVDVNNAVFTITGTPSGSPVQPVIDASTQLQLTFVTVGAGAAKMLETELAKTGIFDMYTRAEMDKVLKEQALGQTGMVTAQSAAKTGQLIGVNTIAIGTITEFGEKVDGVNVFFLAGGKKSTARVVIDVQLVDTTTGRIIKALSATGEEGNVGIFFLDVRFVSREDVR